MRWQKRVAVKEAFDNLPSGICFFDKNGMVKLCNYQMHRLVYLLAGKDLQCLEEMREILEEGVSPEHRQHDIFLLPDGSAWRFAGEKITTGEGETYLQVTAADVTQLYYKQQELEQDNRMLEEYAQRMRRLSANIITLIREEEILNVRMRVHDDIGRCVIAARQLLQQHRPMEELDLTTWKNAVRLLKHDTECAEEVSPLARLAAAAESIGIRIRFEGEFPANAAAAALLEAAVRECMTNAVRHAGATELYVKLACGRGTASAQITNNGAPPQQEVIEGGGLSSLRVRICRKGGTVGIQSLPRFELTVSVPTEWEETP